MATLQGQVTKTLQSVDMSERIYQDIMSISPSRRPYSNRANSAKSANTQFSFFTSPRNSARPTGSRCSDSGSFSQTDIIKSRSWSGSKLTSGAVLNGTAKRGDTHHHSPVSPVPSGGRAPLSPRRVVGSSPSAQDILGKQARSRELGSNKSTQVQRLHEEWAAIDHCRAMKRASEMVQHRLDPMYRLSGSHVPLLERYHVDDSELQRLREMSETSRILQHDLERIKFPHGPRTPRIEKIRSRGRPQGRPQNHAEKNATGADEKADDNNVDDAEAHTAPNNIETSPMADPHPAPEVMHPSSPISTPEVTPREQATEEERESTQQGEADGEEKAEQGETNNGEEESAGEDYT